MFIDEFIKIKKTSDDRSTAVTHDQLSTYEVEYKNLNGTRIDYHDISYGNAVISDGTTIFFRTHHPDYSLIWMDVNGYQKGPNVIGKDMFVATFTKDWIKPVGAPGTDPNTSCEKTNAVTAVNDYGFHYHYLSGTGCSAEYLYK